MAAVHLWAQPDRNDRTCSSNAVKGRVCALFVFKMTLCLWKARSPNGTTSASGSWGTEKARNQNVWSCLDKKRQQASYTKGRAAVGDGEPLLSQNIRWMIQIPRLFALWHSSTKSALAASKILDDFETLIWKCLGVTSHKALWKWRWLSKVQNNRTAEPLRRDARKHFWSYLWLVLRTQSSMETVSECSIGLYSVDPIVPNAQLQRSSLTESSLRKPLSFQSGTQMLQSFSSTSAAAASPGHCTNEYTAFDLQAVGIIHVSVLKLSAAVSTRLWYSGRWEQVREASWSDLFIQEPDSSTVGHCRQSAGRPRIFSLPWQSMFMAVPAHRIAPLC